MFSDWIGGYCPADSLMVWFPLHWAPQVIRELESREFQKLYRQILPNDDKHREGFDTPTDLRIGDPNVHFHAAAAKPYETSGATGKPEWDSLFGFILARMSHLRFLSTVYVLVDTRDLTNLANPDPSLQHWPAVAAWWSSRACMQGPAQDLSGFTHCAA